jgi:hypothetical protein
MRYQLIIERFERVRDSPPGGSLPRLINLDIHWRSKRR